MREIAKVLHSVLAGTKVASKKDGTPSLVNFETDPKVLDAARGKVGELLKAHPLYPEIELA